MEGNNYRAAIITKTYGCFKKISWGKRAEIPACNLAGSPECIKDDGCRAYKTWLQNLKPK